MPKSHRLKAILKDSAVIVSVTILLAFTIEGIASFTLLSVNLKKVRIPAERLHTEYDALLGWINKRNVHIQDMYGPDIYLKTNSQRFRNNRDFSPALPGTKRRWICSGDSFTFGYGVDNDHTWCALLSSTLPEVETVNMGQGGYGLDQIYLWYMRDGIQLQHDVLIVAFITEDIPRMALNKFLNYPKPHLSVQDGQIIKNNVPVPQPGFITKYLPRYDPLIAQLGMVRLANEIREKLKSVAPAHENELSYQDIIGLTLSIFTNLNDYNKKAGRTVFFVHLPSESDYKTSPKTDRLRAFLHSKAKSNGWYYLDLIDDLRDLNPASIAGLFIQRDIKAYTDARGHYSVIGNRYIAGLLADKIARHLSNK